ncbi:MAG: Fumarylacetoacetate (FAA) hydrolase family protein [candidate division BRC1 bacterium ADurb.BinA364]|nr:MAG: Fumarylacetoacetate (FAA) hydrolase family protein [candidate division BRC1 bacterium ADurb.BinA364]
MKLYKTRLGPVVEEGGNLTLLRGRDWDVLFAQDDLHAALRREQASRLSVALEGPLEAFGLEAPIRRQEVWGAGVTYLRSRTARMEESAAAGGGGFYDAIYHAERPELFFKAAAARVAGPGEPVHIRRDSRWSVPEPELALALSATGRINGYTAGNDMSARDLEGENPLYLPQAKTYDGCCALGPCVFVTNEPLPPGTAIRLSIRRGGLPVFEGETALSEMKRGLEELAGYLFRESSFPYGCFLLTGTGIVPPDDFALAPGDEIRIEIEPIGALANIARHASGSPPSAPGKRDAM